MFFGVGAASAALNDLFVNQGTKSGIGKGLGSFLLPSFTLAILSVQNK